MHPEISGVRCRVHLLSGTKGRESGRGVNILLSWECREDGKPTLLRCFRVNRGTSTHAFEGRPGATRSVSLLYTISGCGAHCGRQLERKLSTWKGLAFGGNVGKQNKPWACMVHMYEVPGAEAGDSPHLRTARLLLYCRTSCPISLGYTARLLCHLPTGL